MSQLPLRYAAPVLMAITLSAATLSCTQPGDGKSASYPRPYAYPRLQLCDSTYVAASTRFPLHLEYNAGATLRPTGDTLSSTSEWFDIIYPANGPVIYTTISRASGRESVAGMVENRRKRMELNAGDRPTQWSELSSMDGSFDALMAVTRSGSLTPVQFLATDGSDWVISATAHFPTLTAAAANDSLTPAIDMLERDIIHTILTLSLPQ